MNETSTTNSSFLSENLIRTALRGVSYGKPSEKTLALLRSVAHGLRFVDGLPEDAAVFSLN